MEEHWEIRSPKKHSCQYSGKNININIVVDNSKEFNEWKSIEKLEVIKNIDVNIVVNNSKDINEWKYIEN